MKSSEFKRQLMFVVFMLLGCLSMQATADDLMTDQITLNNVEAGTLPNRISSKKKYRITNLKINGEINGTDLKLISDMAGRPKGSHTSSDGKLSVLDLSDAKIVSGGRSYYEEIGCVKEYYSKNDEIGDWTFYKCSCLTSLTLPSGVTSIGEYAFQDCSNLTSVILPSKLASIGYWAFNGCSSLKSLTLPSSLTSISWNAFGASNLNDVRYEIYGDLATYIQSDHPAIPVACPIKYYLNGQEITNIEIPSSVTSIGSYVFDGCSELTNLNLSSNLTSISRDAFRRCSNLKDVRYDIYGDLATYVQRNHSAIPVECPIKYYLNNQEITSLEIPSGVTTIGSCAFYGCSGLTSLTLPSSVTSIGDCAFESCSGLTSLTLPSGVTSIGYSAFKNCSGLTNISLPSDVTSIGSYAFYGCSGLTSLAIPSGVVSIEESVFKGCSGLKSITLPLGLTSIGLDAFYGCSGLTSLTLPSGITSIGSSAFLNCSGLTSLILPSALTSIGLDAFHGCSGLTSLVLPSNLNSIGDWAFASCSGLTSLVLPSKGVSIGKYAFVGCTSLKSLTFSSCPDWIGECAFWGCSGLTNLVLPSDLTDISNLSIDWIFSKLESVYVGWQIPIAAGSFFKGISISNCTLYVPHGTKGDYWSADVWGDFGKIVEYDATGINNVINRSEVKEVSRYSLGGQRLVTPVKGLNIVVYSDGSIKKVVVK